MKHTERHAWRRPGPWKRNLSAAYVGSPRNYMNNSMTFQEVLVSNVANHYTVTQSLPDFTTNYQPGVDRIWYDFNFQIHGLLLGINFIFYLLQDGCTSCLSLIKLTHYCTCRIVLFTRVFAMRRLFEYSRRLFHLGGRYQCRLQFILLEFL